MTEYDVVVKSNGIHTPIAIDIQSRDEAVKVAEEWFNDVVKGKEDAVVLVLKTDTVIEEQFYNEHEVD